MKRKLRWAHLLLASIFLLLIAIGATYYIAEVKQTLELVKSERAEKTELAKLNRKDIPIRVIQVATITADREKYAVVDVREKEEFATGHVKGAVNFRLGEILHEESVRQDLVRATAGKQRVFYCHDGKRSRLAAQAIQQESGGVNLVLEKGFQQIKRNAENREIWEGSLKHVLPQAHRKNRTPWIKRRNVRVNTLIDLSLEKHESVERLEGKTFRHAPLLLMSNRHIDDFISTLGDEPIVALCDSKVSCFSTRILRYRLEERGMHLAGFVRIMGSEALPASVPGGD
ncbi:MAG: rhodanese-like domain-containing protein [Pseudomonadota bacterium]